MGLELMSVS